MPTPDSLRALLTRLIDYAGLFPPASLDLPTVLANYERYAASGESWMLNRLVLRATQLDALDPRSKFPITLIDDAGGDHEPFALPDAVQSIETKSERAFTCPVYRELPLADIEDGFAKIRTGGETPEATPSSHDIAEFLTTCAARQLAFKATAGLHHPIRSSTMHGFINVFTAAAFAWNRNTDQVIVDILDETDPHAFQFTDEMLSWRDQSLETAQVDVARRDFAHSFGSCSFDEPVDDLRNLGWL
jgi:hypothetical protein